jgi:hypothetical protein
MITKKQEKTEKIIIKDWAGNVLDFRGHFKLPQLAAAMEFDDVDSAHDWILINVPEDSHDDVFVCVIEED